MTDNFDKKIIKLIKDAFQEAEDEIFDALDAYTPVWTGYTNASWRAFVVDAKYGFTSPDDRPLAPELFSNQQRVGGEMNRAGAYAAGRANFTIPRSLSFQIVNLAVDVDTGKRLVTMLDAGIAFGDDEFLQERGEGMIENIYADLDNVMDNTYNYLQEKFDRLELEL